VLAGLLGVGLVIDVIDGQPLKLATSVFLFAACLLSALVPPPRKGLVRTAIIAFFGGAALLIVFRVFGSGL